MAAAKETEGHEQERNMILSFWSRVERNMTENINDVQIPPPGSQF